MAAYQLPTDPPAGAFEPYIPNDAGGLLDPNSQLDAAAKAKLLNQYGTKIGTVPMDASTPPIAPEAAEKSIIPDWIRKITPWGGFEMGREAGDTTRQTVAEWDISHWVTTGTFILIGIIIIALAVMTNKSAQNLVVTAVTKRVK